MKKRIRTIILIITILLIAFFISIPVVLNFFIDKEKLRTIHNQNSFDSFVLNIKICLANNEYILNSNADWMFENCEDINKYNCENIIYEDFNLTLEKCEVNGQLFSYINGKIIIN